MKIQVEELVDICRTVNVQINDYCDFLRLYHIIYHDGQRGKTLTVDEEELLAHPAGVYARNILRREMENDYSTLLGIAVASERKILSRKTELLGLVAVNIDQFEDEKDAILSIYHLAWHAINLSGLTNRPEYKSKLKNGPIILSNDLMEISRANLKADVFSVIMMALQGDSNAAKDLAYKRALESISAKPAYKPEKYPYPIAMEVTQFILEDLPKTPPPRERLVITALRIAEEVGIIFENKAIHHWWQYCKPAQRMSWYGASSDRIIGAASNTGDNPYVRANGLLISEILGITPRSAAELSGEYNSYVESIVNEDAHKISQNEAFNNALKKSIASGSGRPFLVAADEQNVLLVESYGLGWCAYAFHYAAQAFDSAKKADLSCAQLAKLEFEGMRNKVPWDIIDKFSKKVMVKRRNGDAVNFCSLIEYCSNIPDLAVFAESLLRTLRSQVSPEIAKLAQGDELIMDISRLSPELKVIYDDIKAFEKAPTPPQKPLENKEVDTGKEENQNLVFPETVSFSIDDTYGEKS